MRDPVCVCLCVSVFTNDEWICQVFGCLVKGLKNKPMEEDWGNEGGGIVHERGDLSGFLLCMGGWRRGRWNGSEGIDVCVHGRTEKWEYVCALVRKETARAQTAAHP